MRGIAFFIAVMVAAGAAHSDDMIDRKEQTLYEVMLKMTPPPSQESADDSAYRKWLGSVDIKDAEEKRADFNECILENIGKAQNKFAVRQVCQSCTSLYWPSGWPVKFLGQ